MACSDPGVPKRTLQREMYTSVLRQLMIAVCSCDQRRRQRHKDRAQCLCYRACKDSQPYGNSGGQRKGIPAPAAKVAGMEKRELKTRNEPQPEHQVGGFCMQGPALALTFSGT